MTAAAPAVIGGIVLVSGAPSAEGLLMWAALLGALLGAYGGSVLQLLRECEDRDIGTHDWVRLALRVSASCAFGVLSSLALAAVAGSIESIPVVAAHPFVVAFIAGAVAAVAPLVVPELQKRSVKAVRDYGKKP